jgi:hypothetical protein
LILRCKGRGDEVSGAISGEIPGAKLHSQPADDQFAHRAHRYSRLHGNLHLLNNPS